MDNFPDSQLLLSGVVGSRAYGFDTPESDFDRRGVVAARPASLFGLLGTPESFERHAPDEVFVHELRKFIGHAHKSNPAALELLWLEDYEVATDIGMELVNARTTFVQAVDVRNSHSGGAASQMTLLRKRAAGEQVLDARSQKYARHALRLLEQGRRYLAEGRLSVRVEDPPWYLGELAAMSLDEVEREYARRVDQLRAAPSVLQAENDFEAASALLVRLRLEVLRGL